MKRLSKKKYVFLFKSSAGEFDWIAPYLLFLKKKKLHIRLVFETRNAFVSLQSNKQLFAIFNNYFKNDSILPFEDNPLYMYINLLSGIKIYKSKNYIITFDTIFKKLKLTIHFFKLLKKLNSYIGSANEVIIFKDYNGESALSRYLHRNLKNAKLVYYPHSNHIFSNKTKMKENFSTVEHKHLVLSNKRDARLFNKLLEVKNHLIAGYTFIDSSWLNLLKKYNFLIEKEIVDKKKYSKKILLISRSSHHIYMSEKERINKIGTIIKECSKLEKSLLIIKCHPRENMTLKDLKVYKIKYPQVDIIITRSHVLSVSPYVDLVISFWSSAVLNAAFFKKPIIEFFKPKKIPGDTIYAGKKLTTIYNHLGIVYNTNNAKEFSNLFIDAVNKKNKYKWNNLYKKYKLECFENKYPIKKIYNYINNI